MILGFPLYRGVCILSSSVTNVNISMFEEPHYSSRSNHYIPLRVPCCFCMSPPAAGRASRRRRPALKMGSDWSFGVPWAMIFNMGVSINGGIPLAGWFMSGKIPSRNGWWLEVPLFQETTTSSLQISKIIMILDYILRCGWVVFFFNRLCTLFVQWKPWFPPRNLSFVWALVGT